MNPVARDPTLLESTKKRAAEGTAGGAGGARSRLRVRGDVSPYGGVGVAFFVIGRPPSCAPSFRNAQHPARADATPRGGRGAHTMW